ncbi:TIGR02391 family protein [Embleya sp. NPDC001921]
MIENAYVPTLGDYEPPGNPRENWVVARHAAIQALGRARSQDEITAFLRPTSPSLTADSLHSWVWESAAPLWAADAHQDAVLAAARTINRRLQKKLDRHDIGETDLCLQSFDTKEPAPGKPRLRFPGDRSTPTWKARQEGAKFTTAGAYLAIRNLAAHEEAVGWEEQQALEYLATFSVIARWIEECTVDAAT